MRCFKNAYVAVIALLVLLLAFPLPQWAATKPTSAPKALQGFSYTHHNIFVPRSKGSQVVNIFIYGWGTFWPFPEGIADESDGGRVIDERIRQAVKDGQVVMLTCAVAPSNYRKSGKAWMMEERVVPAMENQYAARCAQAVKRWPQITRVQVWNELKGYWDDSKNRWDYEGYTRFYNKVYTAVKAVRRSVLVGGGYAGLGAEPYGFNKSYDGVQVDSRAMDAMHYWLKHAVAYDAICMSGHFAPQGFVSLVRYFRKQAPNKPIWWSEYYGVPDNANVMRAARQAIAKDQRPGDISLWWAEKQYPW